MFVIFNTDGPLFTLQPPASVVQLAVDHGAYSLPCDCDRGRWLGLAWLQPSRQHGVLNSMNQYLGILLTLTMASTVNSFGAAADAKQPQGVLIEATVCEVTSDGLKDLNLGTGQPATDASGSPERGIRYAESGADFEALVKKLAQSRHARILQRPRILTSDGVPASLFVGQAPERSAHHGPAVNGIPSQAQEVSQPGMEFAVTPQVGANGLVTLDVRLCVRRVVGSVEVPSGGKVPVTNSQEVQTKLALRNGTTALLAGLQSEPKSQPAPYLGFPKDLPGLAAGRAAARGERTETVVIIRPTLLADKQ